MLGMDAVRQTQAEQARLRSALYRTLIGLLLTAALLGATAAGEKSPEADWDSERYIKVDEIEKGMEAYCLTDYGDAGIERFELKVVDVVRGYEPGHDIILVMGLDERFQHTGPVSGCSGSPVYIGERLAGALARSWYWAQDPLYGVTPIAEMLQVGAGSAAAPAPGAGRNVALRLDFSKPINLAEVDEQVKTMGLSQTDTTGGPTALPCPVLVSGVSAEACRQVASELGEMGFAAVPGLSGEPESGNDDDTASLKPGGVLTIPLIAGDIRATVLGTVTEVRDDKVYGFGHDYLGYGAVNLPLAAGKVYTVVSSPMQSFKLGAAGEIIGAITADESTAIFGRVGAKPKMVPLTIRVERYNDPEVRTYNCQVARSGRRKSRALRERLGRIQHRRDRRRSRRHPGPAHEPSLRGRRRRVSRFRAPHPAQGRFGAPLVGRRGRYQGQAGPGYRDRGGHRIVLHGEEEIPGEPQRAEGRGAGQVRPDAAGHL